MGRLTASKFQTRFVGQPSHWNIVLNQNDLDCHGPTYADRYEGFLWFCRRLAREPLFDGLRLIEWGVDPLYDYVAEAIIILEAKKSGTDLKSCKDSLSAFHDWATSFFHNGTWNETPFPNVLSLWSSICQVMEGFHVGRWDHDYDFSEWESDLRRLPVLFEGVSGYFEGDMTESYDLDACQWCDDGWSADWKEITTIVGLVSTSYRWLMGVTEDSITIRHHFIHHDETLERLRILEADLFDLSRNFRLEKRNTGTGRSLGINFDTPAGSEEEAERRSLLLIARDPGFADRMILREWMRRIRCGAAMVKELSNWKACVKRKANQNGQSISIHDGVADDRATSPAHDETLDELIDKQIAEEAEQSRRRKAAKRQRESID